MENIKHGNSSNHHRAIQRNEIPLRGNQIPIPSLRQLNRPVNTPHIDTKHRENHRREQRHNRPLHLLQQPLGQRPPDKIRRAEHENRNREQLEDDSRDHRVGARIGVAVDLVGFGGGHAAADGLDNERDDVAGAEDPEVEAWAEDRGFAAEKFDEAAEEDVDAGCEEGGCWRWSVSVLHTF